MSFTLRYDMDFGSGWVDVTADVYLMPGDTSAWNRGIKSNRPEDHVADTGLLNFALDNSATNSGATQGWYSPSHPSCRAGFTFGIKVRVVGVWDGVDYPLWRGKLRAILPEPGQYGTKRTLCTAHDTMGDLYEADLISIAPQANKTEVQLLQAIVATLPSEAAPPATSYDVALDTYQYAFDDIGGGGIKALTAGSNVVLSAQGWWYAKADGTLKYENRHTITTKTSSFTFDNTMHGLVVPSDLSNVFNRIRVTVHPRTIDAAATTVLFSQPGAIELGPGQTLDVWGDYADPANSLKLIGGTAQVTPIVSTTDYVANSAADGSGSNQTANLSVVTSAFASTVKFELTNTSGATIYVTKLQIRGKGVYDNAPITVEKFVARPYGDRPLRLDLRYQHNTTIAKDLADYHYALYGNLAGSVSAITFMATADDTLLGQALEREIGDVITLSEEMTGLVNARVVIRGIEWSVAPGPVAMVTWYLSPMLVGSVFILDDATYGVLDSVVAALGYA